MSCIYEALPLPINVRIDLDLFARNSAPSGKAASKVNADEAVCSVRRAVTVYLYTVAS